MNAFPTLTNSRNTFKKIPKKLNPHLKNLGAPHINSFNEMLQCGLKNAVKYMTPLWFETPSGERVKIWIESINISPPQVPLDVIDVKERSIYPAEARLQHKTYAGMCTVRVGWCINEFDKSSIELDLGEVPIMLRSKACNLANLTPAQMVERGEHDTDWGGIWVIKGNERIVRMLLMTRRNYPIAVKRAVWKDRGQNFSEYGILVRSVRCDEVSYNNTLHFLKNGTVKLMISQLKQMFYLPLILVLKSLVNYTDEEIYKQLVRGYEKDQYYMLCLKKMLQELHEDGLHTHMKCKDYLGNMLRYAFYELPAWTTNVEVCEHIMQERVFIHLETSKDKFNFLVFMVQKLFQCVREHNKIENVDSVMMQDVLLSGHLYQKFLCDRIDLWLKSTSKIFKNKLENSEILLTSAFISSVLRSAGNISTHIQSFLATGNAPSRTGLGLMQTSGLSVIAENINRMRYMSHFRAVHRGSFFLTMRTTDARQLLPDAWGFICPVHTPDGTPCGLLNHLTVKCEISPMPEKQQLEAIPKILVDLGMIPIDSECFDPNAKLFIVMLEGKVLGYIRQADANKIVDKLRYLKIENELPKMMEIGYIPYKKNGQFPGLFLFVGPARMMRPVKNIALNKIEYIGTLEQVYMDIAVDAKEAYPGFTTHIELDKTDFLSNLANLIPMPDYNQSPRNMYQCQMGKQTMGTPCLNYSKQAANKMYRLQTPATPLFRPVHYDNVRLDDFAMGTNAVVAVISYTGYDMEDAMIINKAAAERGFAYGSIYKSKFVELKGTSYFARSPHLPELLEYLDNDGLPMPGTKLSYRCPLYCYYNTDICQYKVERLDEKENCVVDSIRYCGTYKQQAPHTICITLRLPRPPTIGDKFASRAGQKGILSQKYPTEDLPFTESGLIPDIIFNPHGFPSRMTIAMMIETMAGKSAALHGLVHDATPFRFSEKNTAIDYFGKLLEAGGYNYYGTERMYSGVDGRELQADIFFGIVHYQRLRHMVLDKYQVRSTGPVDALTQQPIKGRKRGGGVRFGEMERDALISHGAAFLLQDRLFHNSDKTVTQVCKKCGSILGPLKEIVIRNGENGRAQTTSGTCRLCQDGKAVSYIEVPYVFKYLVTELSAMNINARLKLTEI